MPQTPYHFQAASCVVWCLGARRKHNRLHVKPPDAVDVDGVASNHQGSLPQSSKIPIKVENKTVVIVEHQDHCQRASPSQPLQADASPTTPPYNDNEGIRPQGILSRLVD